ncbi:MAG TPA: hypothetical protein VEA44_08765 [Caulobacter sp.]|nr:hypothetical protein [Caulobacter sp.]
MTRTPLIPLLLALFAAGCASAPRIEVARTGGVDLSPGATYALSADEPVAGDLRRALSQLGWREDPQASAWRIEASYVVRPEEVGAYAGEDPAASGAAWLDAPGRRRWWRGPRQVRRLTLVLTDGRSGATGGTLSARLLAGPMDDAVAVEALAKAALSPP